MGLQALHLSGAQILQIGAYLRRFRSNRRADSRRPTSRSSSRRWGVIRRKVTLQREWLPETLR
jgi:hypothetical protein